MSFAVDIAINALEITLILNFLAKYLGYRQDGAAKYWGTAFVWGISLVNISFFSWMHLYASHSCYVQILINFVFCCLLLRGSVLRKILLSVCTMGLVTVVATFTALLFVKMSGPHVTYLFSQLTTIRLAAVLTVNVLFFIITRVILRVNEDGKIKWIDFIPLVVIPVISIVIITLMMYATMQELVFQNMFFYAVCILLALNNLIYFLFVRFTQTSKLEAEMELLNMQNQCMQENAKDIENMYENVRALRHDMKNHLLCISSMAEENDVRGIRDYTGELLQEQRQSDKLILFSGNQVLDAIVNSKCSLAEQAGVQLRTIVTTAMDTIAPDDIVILLGNALDNAIRAAKSSQAKIVDLHIQPQGTYLSVMVANSIDRSVLDENPALCSTKNAKNEHGFGIKNMRKAVERNHGMIRFYEKDGRFICDALLLNLQTRNES